MKRTLSAATVALLTLTACNSTEAEAEPAPNITPIETAQAAEPDEAEAPEEDLSERGSHIMEPGDEGYIADEQDNELLTFTVHSIEVNPECTADNPSEPEHGNFVVFEVDINSDLAITDYYIDPDQIFNSAGYRVIDEDGVTRSESPNTGPSHICFPEAENLPMSVGPGEKASGKVVFDVPIDTGTLVTDLSVGENMQWEWDF